MLHTIDAPTPAAAVDTTSSAGLPYSTRILRGSVSVIQDVELAWRDLCRTAPGEIPFYTPEWIRQWMLAFEPESMLVLFLVMQGAALVGIVPFIEETYGAGPWRLTRLKAPGNVYTERIDAILPVQDRGAIVDVLWDAIRRQPWTVLDWRPVPADGAFASIVRRAEADHYPTVTRRTHDSPYLAYGPDTDVVRLGPASQFRRHKRKLEQVGSCELVSTSPATPDSVQRFIDLESASWKGQEGTDVASTPAARTFFERILTTPATSYAPVAYELRVDGQTIAIDVGITMANRYYSLKHSYDAAYGKYGVGHIKVHEILTRQAASGFREFDFLGANEEYKQRWTGTTRLHQHHLIFRPTVPGRILQQGMLRAIPLVKRLRTSSNIQRLRARYGFGTSRLFGK